MRKIQRARVRNQFLGPVKMLKNDSLFKQFCHFKTVLLLFNVEKIFQELKYYFRNSFPKNK